jgi:hypothetical protein
VRRKIAQATFCLPQNVLGIAYFGILQLAGRVVNTADVNEIRIVVTEAPYGASLGKYLFVHESLLTEYTVRHEYGHTLQGYRHGPFYLLLEGLVSFVQAGISLLSPSFAAAYFDRWPENEANVLGGVIRMDQRFAPSAASDEEPDAIRSRDRDIVFEIASHGSPGTEVRRARPFKDTGGTRVRLAPPPSLE